MIAFAGTLTYSSETAITSGAASSRKNVHYKITYTIGRMNDRISAGDQEIWFDRDATLELYRTSITAPGADSCGCSYCRNFSQQRQTLYPNSFKGLLSRLGADEHKEWEVFELGPAASNPDLRLYGGWFLFCGGLLEKGSYLAPNPFSFRFSSSFPTGTLPDSLSICAVEFSAEVPWILQEPAN